jgi:hypothetical protein
LHLGRHEARPNSTKSRPVRSTSTPTSVASATTAGVVPISKPSGRSSPATPGPSPSGTSIRVPLRDRPHGHLPGGVLAVSSFLAIRASRAHTFRVAARHQAELSVLSALSRLTLEGVHTLIEEYRQRAGFETVAVSDDTVLSSLAGLGPEDVRSALVGPSPPGSSPKPRQSSTACGTSSWGEGGQPGPGSTSSFRWTPSTGA